jgi:hypothetical protein
MSGEIELSFLCFDDKGASKVGACGVLQAKRLRLLKDLAKCLQICLLDLLGIWLDDKEKMRGQTNCTDFRMNGLVDKSRWKGRLGYFKQSYSPLH